MLPPRLQHALKGTPIWADVPVEDTGGSIVGSKVVAFTDLPALYVYDSGGLLGDETLIAIEREFPQGSLTALWSYAHPPRLQVGISASRTRFASVVVSGIGAQRVNAAVLEAALPLHLRMSDFVGLPRFFVRPVFKGARAELLHRLNFELGANDIAWLATGNGLPIFPVPRADELVYARLRSRDPNLGALAEFVRTSVIGAHVEVCDRRLYIHDGTRESPWFDVPSVGVRAERQSDGRVMLYANAAFAGEPAESLCVYFPDEAIADRFVEVLTAGGGSHREQPATAKVSSVAARVVGLSPIARQEPVDLIIEPPNLVLHSGHKSPVRLDWRQGAAAVHGKLVIAFDPQVGLLGIECEQVMRAALDELADAAEPSAVQRGRFPGVDGDGAPVLIIEAEHEHHVIRVAERSASMAIGHADIRGMERASDALAVTHSETLRVTSSERVIEALHASLLRAFLRASAAPRLPELIRATMERECEWVAANVFGPFVDVHAGVYELLDRDDSDGDVKLRNDADVSKVIEYFAVAVPALRAHLDACILRLPAFVVKADAAYLGEAVAEVPPRVYELEGRYRVALGNVASGGVYVERIAQQVLRARALSGPRGPNFAGAGIALAASVFNPGLLVNAASQAFSAQAAHDSSQQAHAALLRELAHAVLAEWHYLMREILPPVLGIVKRNVAPLRAQLGLTLESYAQRANATGKQQLLTAVASRYARLESQQQACSPGSPFTRRESLALLDSFEGTRPRFTAL